MRSIGTIAGVDVVDVVDGDVLHGQNIRIVGGHIASIDDVGERPESRREGTILPGHGLYAIPGLIDTHVHAMGLLVDTLPTAADLPWMVRQQRHNLRSFLKAGVTTIRDMGAPLKLIKWYAALARIGVIESPRILASGPVLTVAGGYPDFVPTTPKGLEITLGPIRIDLKSLGHARWVVRRLAAAKVDCVKVCYQTAKYDDARTALPALPLPFMEAVVEEAKSLGVKVAIHAIYRNDSGVVSSLACDSIEHLPIDEVMTDEVVRRIARRHVPISTTMMTYGIIDHVAHLGELAARPEGRLEPKPATFLGRVAAAIESGAEVTPLIGRAVIDTGATVMRQNLAKLREAGALICYGTDSGGAITPPGFPHWELQAMVEAGLSPREALQTATTTAADVLGLEGHGRLTAGSIADVVLLRGDPLDDVSAVGEVAAVIQGGRLVHGALA